jgi:hypothetical protein
MRASHAGRPLTAFAAATENLGCHVLVALGRGKGIEHLAVQPHYQKPIVVFKLWVTQDPTVKPPVSP